MIFCLLGLLCDTKNSISPVARCGGFKHLNMWLNLAHLAAALVLLVVPCFGAYTLNGSTLPLSLTKPKSQFFAGVVTRLSPGLVVVSRSIPGRPPEHRTFLITPKTKMARALRLRLRVTVRFQRMIEGDIALEIQIRPKAPHPATASMPWFSASGGASPILAYLSDASGQSPMRLVPRSS